MPLQFNPDRNATVTTEEREGTIIIHLSGHINELAADRLSSRLDEILEKGFSRIIFELGDVIFMGSSGLGQIMRVYRALREEEGYVRVVNPQPLIRDLFELTKLNKLLSIHPTVDEAMAAGRD